MRSSVKVVALLLAALLPFTALLRSQTAAPDADGSSANLRIDSRAVLVDVIVMDRNGNPVTGLKRDASTVSEDRRPQTIDFFEEHTAASASALPELPKLPPDVFSNFSPLHEPAAVNVLLLDSLNTRLESQQFVHQQALKFLRDLKPGSRMAIFTMGLGLHFVQGFTDDPAELFAALGNKKNDDVQASAMLEGQEETNNQQNLIAMMTSIVDAAGHTTTDAPKEMTESLEDFIQENDDSQQTDRGFLTLANLQRLATFLGGFAGRKNVIWFSESPLLVKHQNQRWEDEWNKTFNMLAAARVALYPVDARGVATIGFYQADNRLSSSVAQPSQMIGPDGAQASGLKADSEQRGAAQGMMQRLAELTGGRAFANTNGLSEVMGKISAESADFYTLSYTPSNQKMDGGIRNIEVSVAAEKYSLSYRRSYSALGASLPAAAMASRQKEIEKLAAQNRGAFDPLLAFMDPGMPQSRQILYRLKIAPLPDKQDAMLTEPNGNKTSGLSYAVDFAVDLKDLKLAVGADGLHKGSLNVSAIVYDRYGNVVSRDSRLAELSINPQAYAAFQQTGIPLHESITVPKGNYWLRTGVYDQASQKVGTMEIALGAVVPLEPPSNTSISVKQGHAKSEAADDVAPFAVSGDYGRAVPSRIAEKVTVEQLEQAVASAKGKRDQDLAKRLAGLQLTERLSTPKLGRIQAALPGEKSRLALLALADASAFLQLPAAEIPARPPPDIHAQSLIVARAAESLVSAVHKLPDFFARQTTTRFHDLKISYLTPTSAPVAVEHQAFEPLDGYSGTVYYRDGKEVEERDEKQPKEKFETRDGLVNYGVFGQLQRIVVADVLEGMIVWSHWEQRESGPVAVFRYSIPKERSNYTVNYCCFRWANDQRHDYQAVPAFHGEIAIDAGTGALYRLTVVTELPPSDLIEQAAIAVEYEPVDIGGQAYICPSKSVAMTTTFVSAFRNQCWGGANSGGGCLPSATARARDTSINDTAYSSYHVFRSEARILPAAMEEQKQEPPAGTAPLPDPATPER